MTAETLGERLNMVRRRKGLSLRDAELLCGISPATLSRIETDHEALFWNVVAYARALDIAECDLVRGLAVPGYVSPSQKNVTIPKNARP